LRQAHFMAYFERIVVGRQRVRDHFYENLTQRVTFLHQQQLLLNITLENISQLLSSKLLSSIEKTGH
jgi:hypothetical protein